MGIVGAVACGLATNPHEFRHDRRHVREHVAFGRGAHSCPGAPLAPSEARISFNRILDRMADIRIDESAHGPADDRTYTYDPTFIMRGLSELHVKVHARRRRQLIVDAERLIAALSSSSNAVCMHSA